MLIFVASLALSLGGCSFLKKVGNKIKGGKKQNTEKTMKSEPAPAATKEEAPAAAPAKKKRKRIFCSSKKTYKKGTPCWHWKRGARKGKPAKKADAKK